MELVIDAAGSALRFFEANAAALGIDDPDRVGPDPVVLWLRYAGAGFADRAPGLAPAVSLLAAHHDVQQSQQRWRVSADALDRGHLLVLRNLLSARGAELISMRLASARTPLPLNTLQFPATRPAAGVLWDWQPPDEADIVRNRELRISLAEAPDAPLARRLCGDLDLWIEIVCRSGYCPSNDQPANAGALPTFAYLLDSHTLAVDFDGVFLVDEACFDGIAAYTHRLNGEGIAVTGVSVR